MKAISLPNSISRLVIIMLLMAVCVCPISAQTEQMSERELILESLRCLESGSNDSYVIDVLNQVGDRFQLPEWHDYANLNLNLTDTCHRTLINCLQKLCAYSDQKFGKVSYESVYIRLIAMDYMLNLDLWKQKAEEAYILSTKLYQKDSNNYNKELLYYSRLLHLTGNDLGVDMNKAHEILELLKEIEVFYSDFPRSLIKCHIYSIANQHIQNIGEYYQLYGYCYFLDEVDRKDAMVSDTLYTQNDLPEYVQVGYFAKERMNSSREVFRDFQERVFLDEMAYRANNKVYTDKPDVVLANLQKRLQDLSTIYGDHNLGIVIANQELYKMAKSTNVDMPVGPSHMEDLYAVLYPDGLRQYVSYLCLEASILSSDTSKLKTLCGEIRQRSSDFKPPLRINACMMELLLQRQNVYGYDNVLHELVYDFENQCEHHPDWDLVIAGKELAFYTQNILHDANTALKIEFEVVKMIRSLTSDTSMVFKAEYAQYLIQASNSLEERPENLDGTYGLDSLLYAVKKSTKNTVLQLPIRVFEARYCLYTLQEPNRATEIFKHALDSIHQFQEKEKNPLFLRDAELEAYSHWLYLANDLSQKELETHFGKLEKLMYDSPFSISATNSLIGYYCSKSDWDNALKVIDYALLRSEIEGGINETFLGFLQTKVEILLNQKVDIDQCRQVAEQLERVADKFKAIGNPNVYISLLQLMCTLTKATLPNDILRYKYVRLLYDESLNFYELSNHNDQLYYGTLLRAWLEVCELLYYNTDSYKRPNEYFLLLNIVEEDILRGLLEMEKNYKKKFPRTHTQSDTYYSIVMGLAVAYDLVNQPKVAESYFEKIKDFNETFGVQLLAVHYARVGDAEKARDYFYKSSEMASNDEVYSNMVSQSIHKNTSVFLQCVSAVNDKRWKEAEKLAWQYYDSRQDFMRQNIDYYTQAEMENFIMGESVGGMPIQSLVSISDIKNKKKLIEQSYTINLQQKGLMLRKSNQLRDFVYASNDSAIQASYDSIQTLRKEIQGVDVSTISIDSNPELLAKREKLDALEREVARAYKTADVKQEREITWKDVRNSLHKGEVAVEYVWTATTIIYALIVTPNLKTPIYVPLDRGLEGTQFIYTTLSDNTLTDSVKAEKLYNESTLLYDALWRPLEKHFKGARTIYFSPTGILNMISFQALRVDPYTCLIDRYDLHQLTSTALLVDREQIATLRKKDIEAQVYGAIYYNKLQELSKARLAKLRYSNDRSSPVYLASVRSHKSDAFPFLRNTLYEVDAIHYVLDSMGIRSSEKIGFEPTETEIRNLSGNSPDILHISTHGFFMTDIYKAKEIPFFQKGGDLNPMTCSGLALANAESAWLGRSKEETNADNILTSAEVAELDLHKTKLVVLSACKTGLGEVNVDGVFGLQRGFKQAGVKSICASLWNVSDVATAEMMQLFYTYWILDEMPMQEAMKRAMLKQRNRTKSPYYWASFILLDAIE